MPLTRRQTEELRRAISKRCAALARIDKGNYGRCTDCGIEIDLQRLHANPAAVRCVGCQSVHEKTYAHPGEPKL